jgi:hypothetical protein
MRPNPSLKAPTRYGSHRLAAPGRVNIILAPPAGVCLHGRLSSNVRPHENDTEAPSHMSTKIDRERWSEESKRSYAYHYQATSYEDIHYECSKCGTPSVFTAQEQKISFEEKKNYIWQRRTLCPQCNAELFRLRERERACQARWVQGREVLARDGEFMRDWLEVLQAIPRYSPRYRNSMSQRLETRLGRTGQTRAE